MPTISVIVPVYNTENYLKRCVDSILNQTFSDLEIILVNDGSSDNSPKICDEYAKLDNRIKVIHKKNGGVSEARNFGLNESTSKWVSFIDSDDYIESNMYEILYKNAIDNHVDISSAYLKILNKSLNLHYKPSEKEKNLGGLYNGKDFIKLIYEGSYINGACVSPCGKIYKKEVFENIRYKNTIYEDDQICTHIYLKNYKVYLETIPLYIYSCESNNSITRSEFSEKNMIFLDILYERFKLFKENKMDDMFIKTNILYCNMAIEYYFKIKQNYPEYNFSKYRNLFKEQLKYIIFKKNVKLKDKVRFIMFYLDSNTYKYLINKRGFMKG